MLNIPINPLPDPLLPVLQRLPCHLRPLNSRVPHPLTACTQCVLVLSLFDFVMTVEDAEAGLVGVVGLVVGRVLGAGAEGAVVKGAAGLDVAWGVGEVALGMSVRSGVGGGKSVEGGGSGLGRLMGGGVDDLERSVTVVVREGRSCEGRRGG